MGVMTEKLVIGVMLLIVVGAVGLEIILRQANYVYAQWIEPTDLSGINQSMHHRTSALTAAHNNQTTIITNKR